MQDDSTTITLDDSLLSVARATPGTDADKIRALTAHTLQDAFKKHKDWKLDVAKHQYENHLRLAPGNLEAVYLLASTNYRLGFILAALRGLARTADTSQAALGNLRTFLREIAEAATRYTNFRIFLKDRGIDEAAWRRTAAALTRITDPYVRAYLSWIAEHLEEERDEDGDVLASIIIPAYNAGPFIKECLGSVFTSIKYFRQQTGRYDERVEIIVVDDVSTDDTAAQVFDWIRVNGNTDVTYHRNRKNGGPGYSRNQGFKFSRGNFIFFLDADDMYLGRHIFNCIQFLEENNSIDIIRTEICYDSPIHSSWKSNIERTVPNNIAIRRHIFAETGGFTEKNFFRKAVREDLMWSGSANKFFKSVKIDEATVYFRRITGNSFDIQYEKFKNSTENKEPEKIEKIRTAQEKEEAILGSIMEYLERNKIDHIISSKDKKPEDSNKDQ